MPKTYLLKVTLPYWKGVSRTLELRADQTLKQLHDTIQRAFEFDDDHLYSFYMSGKAWDRLSEYKLPEDYTPFSEMFGTPQPTEKWAPLTHEEMDAEYLRLAEMFSMSLASLRAFADRLERQMNGEPPLKRKAYDAWLEDLAQKYPLDAKPLLMWERHIEMRVEDILIASTERDVRNVKLHNLNLAKGKKFLYLFDYGDQWEFQIKVVKINEDAPKEKYPRIVESVGDAPPQYPNWEEDEDYEYEEGDLPEDEEFQILSIEEYVQMFTLSDEFKQQVNEAFRQFMDAKLKPLLATSPTPLELYTKWHGRFFYMGARGQNAEGKATDKRFAMLTFTGKEHFKLSRMTEKGKWQEAYTGLTLDECLEKIESDSSFRP